ncbi:MAG: branched-chain amino acid ABC transporter permease [Desulfurococcaceae archaeon]
MALELITLFISDLLALLGVYTILTLSLNVQRGYAGIPNFGLLFSFAGGAYITGSLAARLGLLLAGVGTDIDPISNSVGAMAVLNPILRSSPLLTITLTVILLLIGAVTGALLGLIQLGPVIRLRIDYLAITLLALGEVLNYIATVYKPFINGALGVLVPDLFSWAGSEYRFMVATLEILLIAFLVFLYVEYLGRTPLGRVLKAIRENEVAATSLGKNLVTYRAIAMTIGSAFSGIAGALWTLYLGAITPSLQRFDWTFLPWLMIFLGGIGNNRGVFLGTFIFVLINRLLVYIKHYFTGLLPFDVVWFDYISLGIVMALILIYRPQGILPEKPRVPGEIKEIMGKQGLEER